MPGTVYVRETEGEGKRFRLKPRMLACTHTHSHTHWYRQMYPDKFSQSLEQKAGQSLLLWLTTSSGEPILEHAHRDHELVFGPAGFLFDVGTSIPVSYIELMANAACATLEEGINTPSSSLNISFIGIHGDANSVLDDRSSSDDDLRQVIHHQPQEKRDNPSGMAGVEVDSGPGQGQELRFVRALKPLRWFKLARVSVPVSPSPFASSSCCRDLPCLPRRAVENICSGPTN